MILLAKLEGMRRMTRLRAAVSLIRRRLAWLLVGHALKYRLANIEHTMDLAVTRMTEIDRALVENDGKVNDLSTVEERKALKADRETWNNMFFRMHDLHSEVAGFIEYLRGPG